MKLTTNQKSLIYMVDASYYNNLINHNYPGMHNTYFDIIIVIIIEACIVNVGIINDILSIILF